MQSIARVGRLALASLALIVVAACGDVVSFMGLTENPRQGCVAHW